MDSCFALFGISSVRPSQDFNPWHRLGLLTRASSQGAAISLFILTMSCIAASVLAKSNYMHNTGCNWREDVDSWPGGLGSRLTAVMPRVKILARMRRVTCIKPLMGLKWAAYVLLLILMTSVTAALVWAMLNSKHNTERLIRWVLLRLIKLKPETSGVFATITHVKA